MSKKTWWHLSLAVIGSCVLILLTCTPGLPQPQKTPAAEISTDYGAVVINEIAWAGTQAATYDEWIELYNTTGYTINLSMWQLEASDYGPDIPLSGTISPHNYYLLERGDDTTIQDITANLVYGSNHYSWALSNDGEALTLTNAAGEVIDRVNTQRQPWPGGQAAPAYTTMERINAQGDGNRIANWTTFTGPGNGLDAAGNPVQGTPNRRNSVAIADITVKKSGATWCTTGALVSYTIALENTGYITATNTRLTDTLPPSTTFINQKSPFNFIQPDRDILVWDVGEIAPQITRTTITLYVETAIQTGTLRNIITATTGTPETNTSNNQDYWDTTIQPPSANLTLSKTGPLGAIAGSTVTYTLTLTNTGSLKAYAIHITDTLPQNTDDNLTWNLAQLPPGSYKSISFSLNLAETLDGIITNTVQATHSTGQQIQAQWVTTITPTQPTLRLEKTAPATARNGENITYHLVLSNTGPLAAHGTTITDTLSQGLIYLRQDSTYTHTQLSPHISRWNLGTLPGQSTCEITLTAALVTQNTFTGTLTNTAVTYAQGKLPYTVTATTRVLPRLYLYALQPGNYGGISSEAAAITNGDNRPINLCDWCITDRLKASKRACFPEGTVIQPGQILWLAQDADGFYPIWGMDPDCASEATERPVSLLQGEWPGFTDDGESLYLLAPDGTIADALAYGKGNMDTGWIGPSVPFPYEGYEIKGQVLYRKLAPTTGQPVPDTDQAADWAQDPEDIFDGRKLRYPGWDLETLFFPLELTTTANITIAVAPDAMLNLVTQTLAKAQASIRIEAYTLGSTAIYNALEERIQAGVVVTALLDANPAGGMEPVEKWVAQQLHSPPQSSVYFLGGESPRYRYQHAKFMLIDESLALISTDNFGENSAPSDPKSNGTQGHRGFILVTDQPQITGYLKWLFALDCDPVHHNDIFPYNDKYAPAASFTPIPSFDWTTYTIAFSQPLQTTATEITLMHAPEHSLRDGDALLGRIKNTQSGDTIDVMQLNEPMVWDKTAGLNGYNPRIQALIEAAKRGVRVNLMLDDYYDDPLAANQNTATCLTLNEMAIPNLQCRLCNPTGMGVHAKLFLIRRQERRYINLGSMNGSENANKANREVAIQFQSPGAYDYLHAVFTADWGKSYLPTRWRLNLPVILRELKPPPQYPLITEVLINPEGLDAGNEWVELYHPGREAITLTNWTLGDALEIGAYGDGRYTFPEETILLPKQVMVIAACATEFSNRYGFNPNYEWQECAPLVPNLAPVENWEGFGLALGNECDEVLLQDRETHIVDSVAWGGEPRAGVLPHPIDMNSTFPWDATLKRYPLTRDDADCGQAFYISFNPSPGLVTGDSY